LASRGLIIGYDTRFASEDFAAAAAEVVAGNGIKVYLCSKATPTPVISFGVLTKKAGGAIIITASHNPGIWNGFKYKEEHGSSAPEEVTAQIEKFIAQALATGKVSRLPLDKALAQGLVAYLDLVPSYFDQVAKLIDLKAIMIRPEPIAVNLTKLSAKVKELKANVGLATDGDADRMGIVDEKGTFLNQLQVFALLCLYLLEIRGERGPIVKTITTTSMLYRLGEIFNVPVYETTVGFKYVAPIMLAEKALIGGEESGGYGFRGHVSERDGILASLYFLDLMIKTGKTPSELIDYLYRKVGPHYYDRVDVKFPEGERQTIIDRLQSNPLEAIEDVKVVKRDTTDGFRFILADNTWLLIRFSGTEPVLRVYVESDSPARVEKLLQFGKELAGV